MNKKIRKKEKISVIVLFLTFSMSGYGQLGKGMMSFNRGFLNVKIRESRCYRSFSPYIYYVANESWTVGLSSAFNVETIGKSQEIYKELGATVRFFVTPKWKRKFYLQEEFRFGNSSLESVVLSSTTTENSGHISLGIGMYRFLNPNVALHHRLNWHYGFYAERRDNKATANGIYKYYINYNLGLQNFANFSRRDSIRDKPFKAGRIMTDFSISYSSTFEFRDAFSFYGFYGLFVLNNLLIGVGASTNHILLELEPRIRYYIPITFNTSIYGSLDSSLGQYQYLINKEYYAYLQPSLGIHYLFNKNIGAEVSLFYEKDLLSKLSEEKYYGIQSGIRYYFK